MTEQPLTGRYSVMPSLFAGDLPPNYRTDHFGVRVMLDGVEQQKVIGFDTASGEVFRYCVDTDGKPVIDRDNEEFLTELVTGEVTAFARAA